MIENPQAKVYKVAKINDEYKLRFVCNYSTVARARSIISTQAQLAKDKGVNIKKVGKYYFFKTENGTVVMLYYCNINKGLRTNNMSQAYNDGVAAFK